MSKILVTRSSLPSLDEYVDEISSIWDSHWLTNMGEKHKALQKKLADRMSVDNVELLTNGHMALEMVLQAMNLSGEVITTPYTFISTTHAIVRNNLTPVFCDINPVDYTIDVEKIEGLVTERTSAILPVHVYGNICDAEKIQRIADKYGLKVIYDAAHAFGEEINGKGVGNLGDASCFSFHATKVFNTIEGGAVSYKDKEVGRRLYQLKNFGIQDEETIDGIGANAKMNEFCAAMGLCNLRHLDGEIEKRKAVFERYIERLDGCKGIRLNPVQNGVKSNYAYFPIVVDEIEFGIDRNQLQKQLMEKEIYTRKYFYPISNACDCYKDRYDVNETPVAYNISQKVLTLPMYADLELSVVDKICDEILSNQQI